MLRTNKQTDRQTDKQIDTKILPTPTDIDGVVNYNNDDNNNVEL